MARFGRGLVVLAAVAMLFSACARYSAGTTGAGASRSSGLVLPSSAAISGGTRWLISQVHFTSPEEGWVIAASSADRGPRTVLDTTDGGQHWTPVLSWTGNFALGRSGLQQMSMQIVDAAHIFLLDPQSGPANGTLFRTTDGGKTWQTLGLPGQPGPGSPLTFIDPNHGWLLANVGAAMGQSSATVFQTSDSGSHWSVVVHVDYGQTSHGLSSGGDKDSLVFHDAAVGWMTAYGPAGPIIYMTSDGGRDWQFLASLAIEYSSGSGGLATPYPPQFFNQQVGVFPFDFQTPGNPDVLYAYLTSDGGAHWSQVRQSPALVSDGPPVYWQFLDATHWWVGTGAKLWITADGGMSWSTAVLPLPSGSASLALDFVDTHNGYAIVGSGMTSGSLPAATTLLKTTDGGAHWSPLALSGLGQAAAPDLCGDWSSIASSTGSAIAQRYGEIRNCAPLGQTRSTWVITTLGVSATPESPAQRGGVLIYRCTSAVCQDGSTDHPLAGWQYYAAPYCCGVTLLGTPSPTTLMIDNGGHQLHFDTATGLYSPST
jgi:photosystem II stability/assembly factor-like uncharacterized protein